MFIKCFLDFLARAYTKNAEGQDLLLKDCPYDFSGGQHCAVGSPAEPPAESQAPSAHGSPSLSQTQETKVRVFYVTVKTSLTFKNLFIELLAADKGFIIT